MEGFFASLQNTFLDQILGFITQIFESLFGSLLG